MERVKITAIEHLTHDVLKIVAEKPATISYQPGQAVDVSISRQNWEQELRAFTFTSLPDDAYIEFTIKTYPSHNGVTGQLLSLNKGDELLIHDVFGDRTYKGEGIFIAGGAGVTPFIAILKQLQKENNAGNNNLIFANKTKADIILEDKFRQHRPAHRGQRRARRRVQQHSIFSFDRRDVAQRRRRSRVRRCHAEEFAHQLKRMAGRQQRVPFQRHHHCWQRHHPGRRQP